MLTVGPLVVTTSKTHEQVDILLKCKFYVLKISINSKFRTRRLIKKTKTTSLYTVYNIYLFTHVRVIFFSFFFFKNPLYSKNRFRMTKKKKIISTLEKL